MAEEKKPESNGSTGTVPVMAVLAILAGLFLNHSSPYQDERPSNHPIHDHYNAAQDVDTRLWQDPFGAVDGENEETLTEKISIEAIQNGKKLRLEGTKQASKPSSHSLQQIYNGVNPNSGYEISVLAVTLPGGPYQEAAEARMRGRYAVLSALANQGAFPLDEKHIGYFYPDPKSEMVLQKKVVFEWWMLPSDEKKKVLLLWVDESSLFGCPATKLKELLRQATQENPTKGSKLSYAVIGPNTSQLLLEMLKEAEGNLDSDTFTACASMPLNNTANSKLGKIIKQDITYFSAGATAGDSILLEDIKPTTEYPFVSGYLYNKGVTLYRTTATDAELMKVVANELQLRQVEVNDDVVILSEWDTYYGRVMPKAFKDAFKELWPDVKDVDENVHVYSYMQGLDGKLPDQGDKEVNDAQKNTDTKDKAGTDTLIEVPEGQSQKDYLRRLTETIVELDQYLKDKNNRKGVAAIGVLGSDVHDELMILEALRSYFPHKLFFSTDLDAVYSHPTKWSQAHNLLVASAFDLKLRHELQGKIPPFRDSYQTAFFLATQLALKGWPFFPSQISSLIFEEALRPKLFSITDLDVDSYPTKRHQALNLLVTSAFDPKMARKFQVKIMSFRDIYRTAFFLPAQTVLLSREDEMGIDGLFRPSLFEIGRNQPVPLPTRNDTVLPKHWDDRKTKCSWKKDEWSDCKSNVKPGIFATFQMDWSKGVGVVPIVSMLLFLVFWEWIRDRVGLLKLSSYYYAIACVALFLVYWRIQVWNKYMAQQEAEPFYWLEGVSSWPSELLALSACLFAVVFFFWGHMRIKAMQSDLQEQSSDNDKPIFALPSGPDHVEVTTAFPNDLWKKYLKEFRSCLFRRVIVRGVGFFLITVFLMWWNGWPDVPIRGESGFRWHYGICVVAVFCTIILTTWVVENIRLCEWLIDDLSKKPSLWNENAKNWAIHNHKVAPECVLEWLDVQLVVRITATMQPLIWGPVICLAFLVLTRSTAIDDWDLPWELVIVFIALLIYTISAEVILQQDANCVRKKATDQLIRKISVQCDRTRQNKDAIKRINADIESIMALCEGAFRPWYQLPLLQSFGGLGTLVVALQYFEGVWKNGGF